MTTEAKAAGASGGQGRSAEANRLQTHSTTSTQRGQAVPIYLAGRCVCEVMGDTLMRKAKAGEQLRKPPAWSFHNSVLKQARAVGASLVIVADSESGITYRAPLAAFDTKGIAVDRSYGPQTALPLSAWEVVDPGSSPAPPADSQPKQLALWPATGGAQ